MNKKITLAAGIALLTLTVLLTIVYAALSGVFVSAEKVPPCDADDSYAYEAIQKVCELGLMDTYTIDGNVYFYPEMEVTRGEVAKVLVTYLGIDPKRCEKTEIGFADEDEIPDSLLPYVRAALANGLMQLQSEYVFHPYDYITREETAYIFGALCTAEISAGKSENFSDFEEIGTYFEANANKVVDFEIMIGYTDGTFRPKQVLTREELALILYRLLSAEDFIKG